MAKPTFDKTRPLSWSAISSFLYDPEQWYRKYVLGEKEPPSKEMTFGSVVGKKLENDKTFLPVVERLSKMEHAFKVKFGDIPLVGYADSFCDQTFRKLREYKTGKKEWTQKRADEHGQIDMYLLSNYIQHKIPPEEVDVEIVWMPTIERGDFSIEFVDNIEKKIKVFKTKRTMRDVLNFGMKINRIYKEMDEYAKNHQ